MEGDNSVSENSAVAKQSKKRVKAPKNDASTVTVTESNGHFVCALTGLQCGEKAIVTPTYPVGAFINLPALLRHAQNTLPPEKYGPLLQKLAREYHQPREVLIPCAQPPSIPLNPAHIPLVFEKAEMWNAHTILHGLSVAEFHALAAAPKSGSKKTKAEKPAVYTFESGAYVIKSVRGEPRLEKLDGNKETVSAIRHIQGKVPEGLTPVCLSAADYTIWTVAPAANIDAETLSDEVKSTVSILGTQLYGNLAYGNAVVLSYKKQSFKQQ